jgi:DNA-binding NarL/FixJ family response regulator
MNVLLIDDHPWFGVGIAHALAHAGAGIEARTASGRSVSEANCTKKGAPMKSPFQR